MEQKSLWQSPRGRDVVVACLNMRHVHYYNAEWRTGKWGEKSRERGEGRMKMGRRATEK